MTIDSKQAAKISSICVEVIDERRRQDHKWGGPEHDDQHESEDWEEFIVTHARRCMDGEGDGADDHYRKQMIRVAALAVAGVESLDRKIARRKEEEERRKKEEGEAS